MRIRSPGFRLGAAYAVAFSQSGLLLGQVGRQVVAYEVGSRRPLVRSQWHYPHPAAIAFGAASEWMAVRSTTGAMAVVDLPNGDPLSRLAPTTEIADDSPLLPSPTCEHVVEACSSGTLRIRNIEDLRVDYLEQHPADMLGAIATSTDLRRWAIAFNRKQLDAPSQPPCRIELRNWPLSTGSRVVLRDDFGYIAAICSSPDGSRIAVLERVTGSRGEFSVSIVSAESGMVEVRASDPRYQGHRGFAWASCGRWLVLGTAQGHALLDGATLAPMGHLAGEYASDAAFSPDGRLLALGYWGRGVVVPTSDLMSWFSDPLQSVSGGQPA